MPGGRVIKMGHGMRWARIGRSAPAVVLAVLVALGVTCAGLGSGDRSRPDETPMASAAPTVPASPAGAHAVAHPLPGSAVTMDRETGPSWVPAVATEVSRTHRADCWWAHPLRPGMVRIPNLVHTCRERAPPRLAV